jgi:UTP--glucose-1-phosphate uridylyltransferase
MDAVRRARAFTAGERFAVLLPDNLFIGRPVLAQMLDAPIEAGQHIVGVLRVSEETAAALGARGALKLSPIEGDARSFRVESIGPEKTPIRVGPDGRAAISLGRYVFAPDIFDAVDEAAGRLEGGELDDVPIMHRLAGEGRVLGRLVDAEYYDVGNPLGYWRANRRVGPDWEPEVSNRRRQPES